MPFEFAGLTDVGRKREHNEDSLLLSPDDGLVVVADGMGGHQAGEVASNLAVVTIEQFFANLREDPDATWPYKLDRRRDFAANKLVVGIQLANRRIIQAGATEGRQGMGTTVVAALCVEAKAYVAWVGDSRGYLFRKAELSPLTEDHSLLNELLRTGRITPADVPHFQHKNVITRALGLGERVDVDLQATDLEDGDVLLVCCDGLTGMLEDERIASILGAETSLEKACQRLVDAANAAGGTDNITVGLARYRREEST